MDTTRAGLERALAAAPDDATLHAAYADRLTELGDPRGEYIRLQLALEDRDQPADRLRATEQAAFALRRQYEEEWLGPLYPFVHPARRNRSVAEPVEPAVDVQYRRGWVQRLRIRGLTAELATAVAVCPLLTLLAELTVEPAGEGGTVDTELMHPWAAAGFPGSLRRVTVAGIRPDANAAGVTDPFYSERLAALLAKSYRVEQLDLSGGEMSFDTVMAAPIGNLTQLRLAVGLLYFALPLPELRHTFTRLERLHLDLPRQSYGLGTPADFIAVLADPSVCPRLTYLAYRAPDLADAGVEALLASGLVLRLKGLDLCRCSITDDGARLLAADPAVARLEYLHLDNNYLSPVGVEALAEVGVTVSERQYFGPPPAGGADDFGAGEDIPF